MTNYNWNYPTNVWVGKDRANDLEKACVEIKTLKPLLVTDRDLINLEFIKNLVKQKGFNEYFSCKTGKGFGATNFSWTAALFLDLILENKND